MSMEDYERAKAIVAIVGGSDFVGGRKNEWVTAAEAVLELKFPPTYRRFLLEFGCGGFGSEEFYGIVSEDLLRGPIPNGIWLTHKLRQAGDLSAFMVIVQARGDGTHCAIDTSQRSGDLESPIVLLDVSCRPGEELAEDFGRFFLDRILVGAGENGPAS